MGFLRIRRTPKTLTNQADNPILVSKFVQGYGVYAKRVSYLPTDHDGITSWPIIDQPCYIVPASALTDLVATDNQSQIEPLKSAPVQPRQ